MWEDNTYQGEMTDPGGGSRNVMVDPAGTVEADPGLGDSGAGGGGGLDAPVSLPARILLRPGDPRLLRQAGRPGASHYPRPRLHRPQVRQVVGESERLSAV